MGAAPRGRPHETAMTPKRSFELTAFLRALFLIFTAAVYTSIICPPALVSCLLDPSGRWPSFFQKLWVKWLLRTNRIRLNLRGLENLNKGESFILVSNHASILDIPGIISAAPFPVRFIAKKSLIWFPVFGWFLRLSGHILIDRQNAASAVKGLRKAVSLLKRGISIIVFAEGTRSPDGAVKDFKRGAFLLAQHSKFPVVPVSIRGSFEMLPRRGWCFWPGTISILLGKPISTGDLSHAKSLGLMERVRNIILNDMRRKA